jgi:glycerophosphoryl diester phosphodiesterase
MRRSTVGTLIIATVAALGLAAGTGIAAADTAKPFMVGHRGGSAGTYVENTIGAFTDGAQWGTWLEADIRFTKDDVPVVLHDPNIDRITNGSGPVGRYTYAQLRRYRTADGQTIASFAQLTGFLKRAGKKAFIELKQQPANARQWALLEKAAAPVKSYVIIYSKFAAYLKVARSHGFQTALYERWQSASPSEIKRQGNYYFRQYESVTKTEMKRLAKLNVKVILFTSTSKKGWEKAQDLGAWGVLTDDAAAFAAWRH